VLSFNEGKACDAVIRHLELRLNLERRNLALHDKHPDQDKRVEATFELGPTLYAIEHTGIEPFPGFVRLNAESARFHTPIVQGASAHLPDDEIFHLGIPVDAFFDRTGTERRRIQEALIDFIVTSSDQIPLRNYGDNRRPSRAMPVMPPNVPFTVTLHRYRPPPNVPVRHKLMLMSIVSNNSENLRVERMRNACAAKFPKLAAWKDAHDARTILVLEDNDIQLTNHAIVTDTYAPIARDRVDRPDETYLVMTAIDPWWICSILVDGKDFFEIDEEGIFEVNSSSLSSITLR
jgi:hypothetical protein